ncbi:TetR/AcrR family transcriptional regulator [Occultella glacieicola]|uniref:TetR/AcrR family transcriptional regulator n=1 Tax=Occultella glacieicola TaxID=2518684 RepID=A0ABY2E8I8_9MICO|nr:TetR/AcrR family transcriptional regulator [Occultella glacieicola]TDE94201.1 TetR/AcrR family transcriptional regulator [Occultella glacieicola]
MGSQRTPREGWVEEGLRVLAESGVDAVRVEAIAKNLGVTKGGFYGYFADRAALLQTMLDTWERESVDEVLEQVQRLGGDVRSQAISAGELTFSNDRLLPIDLAIRSWARRDDTVAARLARLDGRRMDVLRATMSTFCDDPLEVEARSLMAFCVAIGEHYLATEHGGLPRAHVIARAAELLLSREPMGGPDLPQ